MKVNLIDKKADFLYDKEGVMIVTDIEKTDFVVMSELIYDGKNVAILNRNNKGFFALKNIAPQIREKIKEAAEVTIVEKDKKDIYSYKVKVHLTDNLGFEDDFDEYAQKIISDIEKKLSPEEFEKFLSQSQKAVETLEN